LTTSLIVLEGDGQAQEYVGGYRDYLRQRGPRTASPDKAAAQRKASAAQARPKAPARKLTYKDARALELLPGEIAALETEIAGLDEKLADPALFSRDPDAFAKAAQRLEAARAEVAEKEDRWLELEAAREALESTREG